MQIISISTWNHITVEINDYPIYSINRWPKILSHKKMILSYIAYNEWRLTFGNASIQKYFFNVQWQRENFQTVIYTFKITIIQSKSMRTLNTQCSLDLDVAYCVYLDISKILKLHYWYIIA